MKPLLFAILYVFCAIVGPAGAAQTTEAASTRYTRMADEMAANLRTQVLAKWFPGAVDPAGGFRQNYREDWSLDSRADRALVYQARLTWVAAQAAERYPATAAVYRSYALHGLVFLQDRMWDSKFGGLYWALSEDGSPERGGEKHVYGLAFAIYALAACWRATHDPRALDLAKRTYGWLDSHAHDRRNGGYFEALNREGTPIMTASAEAATDFIGTHYGYKSMNTHIHVLEALTALYGVWPDAGVRRRLEEGFALVRDRIAVEPGCLNLFLTPDWRPVPGFDSFGHDLETAYLLVEASTTLGRPEDAATWRVARKLVDHALELGWDRENGGFYDTGTAFGPAVGTDKIWWTQAEGLNALALMYRRTKEPRYGEALDRQWTFIKGRQVDAVHGGWYPVVDRAGAAPAGRAKSDRWTEAYHQSRALMVVSAALRGM